MRPSPLPSLARGFYLSASESAQVIRTPGQERGGGAGKLQQGLVAGGFSPCPGTSANDSGVL
ncbi:hypothetical protein A6R68_15506 [Neotoma lepida]|uniref:Uncharacterized protein n=1 Tax=Neotoma lepida TaxID=56216 RepID=A0A1A6H6M9_NEOLE|nr:hypothetical protein A6R68_15506 [Neotoma lepida]